jgi:UDP-2-acetamido-3-amino-2,3-dideoxy-glucuronate N-acetyltransferase
MLGVATMFVKHTDLLVSGQVKEVTIDATSVVESSRVGSGTRVGAFSHVTEGAVLGEECILGDHVVVASDAILGDGVTVEAGVCVPGGVVLEDGVFVGSQAVFAQRNDPRSRQQEESARTVIRRGASVGSGAVIHADVEVGAFAMIRPGSVVKHPVPAFALVEGNPAKVVGRVDRLGRLIS